MTAPDPPHDVPAQIDKTTSVDVLALALRPRSDLTYKTIDNLVVRDISLFQSLFTGSFIRESTFVSVDFSRCDFDSVRIERSVFDKCVFENAELRSAVIAGSTFRDCNLNFTNNNDCSYEATALERCTLVQSVFTESSVVEGAWTSCDITGSSFIRNDFRHVHIQHMSLGDCTFSYNVMHTCRFTAVSLNVESAALIYGLTRDDLEHMTFIHLGVALGAHQADDIIATLMSIYSKRGWDIGVVALQLNYRLAPPLSAITEYLPRLREWTRKHRVIKKDDVLFLGRIMQELATTRRLPILACIHCLDYADEARRHIGESANPRHGEDTIRQFASTVTLLMQDLLDETQAIVLPLERRGGDIGAVIRLRYRQKPTAEVADILNDLTEAAKLSVCRRTEVLRAHTGSYEEVLASSLYTAAVLQILLILLNGMMDQVTELKARFGVCKRKRLPREYTQRALQPGLRFTKHLTTVFGGVVKRALGLSVVNTPDLGGLNGDNIEEISVNDDEDDSSD